MSSVQTKQTWYWPAAFFVTVQITMEERDA